MSRTTLAQALQTKGLLNTEQLEQAEAMARSRGLSLERAVVALQLAPEADVWRCLAEVAGLPFADPSKAKPSPEILAKVPREQIEAHHALPVLIKDGRLFVAIDDPIKTWVADDLAFMAGCEVRCALAPPTALKEAIQRVLTGSPQTSTKGKADGQRRGVGA